MLVNALNSNWELKLALCKQYPLSRNKANPYLVCAKFVHVKKLVLGLGPILSMQLFSPVTEAGSGLRLSFIPC